MENGIVGNSSDWSKALICDRPYLGTLLPSHASERIGSSDDYDEAPITHPLVDGNKDDRGNVFATRSDIRNYCTSYEPKSVKKNARTDLCLHTTISPLG
eukprot:scaffold14697_cov124-Cylindrotheca_fusiformis.AAC.2